MRYVLVTGSSGGIGRAISTELARNGFSIVAHYNRNRDSARELKDSLTDMGVECHIIQADLSTDDGVEALAREALDISGGIDVLVNNAGVYRRVHFQELELDQWHRTMAVNLTAPFILSHRLSEGMKRGGWGRIINISSVLAFTGSTSGADYASAKAGLLGLTKSMAIELGPHGITVNAVAPGPVDTDIIASDTPEKRAERIRKTPLGRIGQPEDIAGAVAFLASEKASHITGQVLHVNGGYFIG